MIHVHKNPNDILRNHIQAPKRVDMTAASIANVEPIRTLTERDKSH